MILVDDQIVGVLQDVLDKLVGGLNCLESVQGDGVLHSGIVSVKGNDIVHTHIYQLLQSDGAVQRFPGGALVAGGFRRGRA